MEVVLRGTTGDRPSRPSLLGRSSLRRRTDARYASENPTLLTDSRNGRLVASGELPHLDISGSNRFGDAGNRVRKRREHAFAKFAVPRSCELERYRGRVGTALSGGSNRTSEPRGVIGSRLRPAPAVSSASSRRVGSLGDVPPLFSGHFGSSLPPSSSSLRAVNSALTPPAPKPAVSLRALLWDHRYRFFGLPYFVLPSSDRLARVE